MADEIGDRRRLMWIDVFRCFLYTSLGQFDRAVSISERAYALAKAIGYAHPGPPELVAWANVLAGQRVRARETIEEAVRLLAGFLSEGPTAYGVQALVLLDAGEIEAAKRVLTQASEALEQFPRADHLMVGGAWLALGWMSVDEPARARALATGVLEQLPVGWLAEVAAFSHVVLGRIAADEREFAEAEQELQAATVALGDVPLLPARVELELGWHHLNRLQGKAAEAQGHLRNAEALIAQISAMLEDPRIRESFQTSYVARRVQAAREAFATA